MEGKMKRNILIFIIPILLLLVAGTAWGQGEPGSPHNYIAYSKYIDIKCNPCIFKFTLFNDLDEPVWSEAGIEVERDGKYIYHYLGSVVPLEGVDFSQQMWVQTEVRTDEEEDYEVVGERDKLEMVPYSFYSETSAYADTAGDADTVDSMHAGDFAATGHSHSGRDITTGTVAENRIDYLIARDTEVTTAVNAHATRTDNPHSVTAAQAGAAVAGHNHDTRYYDKAYVDALEARIAALESLLSHFSKSGNEIYITGANLHVVNGSGATNGTVNGLGNIIIGYDEIRGSGPITCSLGAYTDQTTCEANGGVWALSHKSGSHNLVVGPTHNYSRYGGIVVGNANQISGNYSSVSGGAGNTASGEKSSVSGGNGNTASSYYSSVSGGSGNTASSHYSSVSGGIFNTASYWYSSVSGGYGNTASNKYSSVSGGRDNTASGENSSVSGGNGNTASNNSSSVSGGMDNTASGENSSVSGGVNRSVTGIYDWRAGWLFETN
jgi:hypothetical protein